jgi:hypothetical protein
MVGLLLGDAGFQNELDQRAVRRRHDGSDLAGDARIGRIEKDDTIRRRDAGGSSRAAHRQRPAHRRLQASGLKAFVAELRAEPAPNPAQGAGEASASALIAAAEASGDSATSIRLKNQQLLALK